MSMFELQEFKYNWQEISSFLIVAGFMTLLIALII